MLSLSSNESKDKIDCLVDKKAYKSKNFNDSFQAPLQTRLNNQRDTILNVSLVSGPYPCQATMNSPIEEKPVLDRSLAAVDLTGISSE